MMEEHERTLTFRQFIEVMLKVPVVLCPGRIEAVEVSIKEYFPDFIKNSLPFFITRSMAKSLQTGILYHVTDFINLHFNLFLYGGGTQLLIVGPYLSHSADTAFCEQILQDNEENLSLFVPSSQFYLSLSVVGNFQMLEVMRTAMRVITGMDREILYLYYEPQRHYTQGISSLPAGGVDKASMELLEHRCYHEELLLQKVAQGSQDLALKYYRRFSQGNRPIVRTEDPLHMAENLGFSLNTMFRKSAEIADIHPVYLDIISSNLAILIKGINSIRETEECKSQVISAHCRLARKDRLDRYSPPVRKTATYICIHLADQFTLAGIIKGIRVNPSHLSRLFNRETEDSVFNFITKARVEKAAGFLSFSSMFIQNITFYVGFGDLSYFSKCFKKYKKITPTECRASSSIGV